MAADSQLAFARAVRAYERGRFAWAATFAFPLGALAVLACCLGTRVGLAVSVGTTLVATAWVFLWRGQTLGRAVFPGVVAGLVPLALAFGARSVGHVCTGSECVSLCVPACTAGGLVAGVVIARAGRHASSQLRFYGGASALAVLVGALGCSCVGFGGVAGLGLGLLLTMGPVLIRRRVASGNS